MPAKRKHAALYSSEDITWNSPEVCLERVRAFKPIELDPCSNSTSIVNAKEEWILERDGDSLKRTWGKRFTFVNPPYGRHLAAWFEKIALEASKGTEIITLTPSRTDTKWFQGGVRAASAVCFWTGRWKSPGAKHSAPFPSALMYFGRDVARFRQVFERVGLVWDLNVHTDVANIRHRLEVLQKLIATLESQ